MVGTITHRNPDFFPNRINMYVKAMAYAVDVHDDGFYKLPLGSPAIASAAVLSASAAAVVGGASMTLLAAADPLDAVFGRNVTFSVDNVVITGYLLTVTGFDYLGQKMQETIAAVQNATTSGLKAFARATEATYASGTGAASFTLGFGDVLGLPYKTISIEEEIADGAVQGAGTHVAPVLTDPQTISTGDPRGTYNPTVVLDGAVDIMILAKADNWANAAGNGGYYGIAQFSA